MLILALIMLLIIHDQKRTIEKASKYSKAEAKKVYFSDTTKLKNGASADA